VHAHARRLRSRAELVRELVVREVVDEAQPDRVELGLGKLCKGLVETLDPRRLRLDRRGLAVEPLEDPEPVAGCPLEPAAAHRLRDDVARDGEEPRSSGAAGLVAEAVAGEPCLREGLRGEVVRGIVAPRPAEVEPVHPVRVAVVELPERLRLRARGREELRIGRHRLFGHVVSATSSIVSSGDGAKGCRCYVGGRHGAPRRAERA